MGYFINRDMAIFASDKKNETLMKRLFLFLTATMLTLGMWAQEFIYDGIKYKVTSNETPLTVEVARNENISGSVEIPASVESEGNNYVVTAIGDNAFFENPEMISITLPVSVVSIGEFAFAFCENLTSVTISGPVTNIDWGAFVNCTNLTSIDLPSTLETIGTKAFGWSGLVSIEIPSSVNFIACNAFSYCLDLTSITVSWNNPAVVTYGDDIFDETDASKISLYVPFWTRSLYLKHDVWKDLSVVSNGEADDSTALLSGLTASFGSLEFYPGVFSYSLFVPQSISTINLIATAFGEASISGDGQKTPATGENNFEIVVTSKDGSNRNTYTITIIRRETDYTLDFIDATPRIGIYSYNLGNIQGTIEIVDEYKIKYQLTTGQYSGNLPLNFDLLLNGRQRTATATIPVNANSIYEFILYAQLNTDDITFTTHMDAYGRPSYVTINNYNFHPCNITASDDNYAFYTTVIDIPLSIKNVSIIDIAYKGEGSFLSIPESALQATAKVYPTITSGIIYIDNPSGETVQIYSISGDLLLTSLASVIDLSTYPKGMYLVRVGGTTVKIIKK